MSSLSKVVTVGMFCVFSAITQASASTIYAVGGYGDRVRTIDTETWTLSPLFNPGINWFGAADGDNERSFFATSDGGSLYRIDVIDQTVTPIGSYSGPMIKDLARDTYTGMLYGTDNSKLFRINTSTGVASLIGSFGGPAAMWALEFDPSLNTLFGVNQDNHTLYSINKNTGAATAIAVTDQDRITDLWYDVETGQTLAVANGPGRILQLDVGTGAASVLATLSAPDPDLLGLGAPIVPEPTVSSLMTIGSLIILARRLRNRSLPGKRVNP